MALSGRTTIPGNLKFKRQEVTVQQQDELPKQKQVAKD